MIIILFDSNIPNSQQLSSACAVILLISWKPHKKNAPLSLQQAYIVTLHFVPIFSVLLLCEDNQKVKITVLKFPFPALVLKSEYLIWQIQIY